jgi:exodeoxyribonuclease III
MARRKREEVSDDDAEAGAPGAKRARGGAATAAKGGPGRAAGRPSPARAQDAGAGSGAAAAEAADAGPLEEGSSGKATLAEAVADIPPRPARDGSTLRVVSWNVNGLRALLRAEGGRVLRDYVAADAPDVLCLQETKIDATTQADLPELDAVLPGYAVRWCGATHGKKGYAGVATLWRTDVPAAQPVAWAQGVGEPAFDGEGRVLTLHTPAAVIVNAYVPNSGMKLERLGARTEAFDPALRAHMARLVAAADGRPVLLVGDLNVAHHEIDLRNPAGNRNRTPGFCDAERAGFDALLGAGFRDTFRDAHPRTRQYSYWSYRFDARAKNAGWRVDYVLVDARSAARVAHTFVRGRMPGSDHVPVGADVRVTAEPAAGAGR